MQQMNKLCCLILPIVCCPPQSTFGSFVCFQYTAGMPAMMQYSLQKYFGGKLAIQMVNNIFMVLKLIKQHETSLPA